MSALFWSPLPPSTMTVPSTWEGAGVEVCPRVKEEKMRERGREREQCKGGGDEKQKADVRDTGRKAGSVKYCTVKHFRLIVSVCLKITQ